MNRNVKLVISGALGLAVGLAWGFTRAFGHDLRQLDVVDSDRRICFLLHGDDLSHAVEGSDYPLLHRRTTFEASPSLPL